MLKTLWIMNKYVLGTKEQRFYPRFLQNLVKNLALVDIDLKYVLFTENLASALKPEEYYLCPTSSEISDVEDTIIETAQRIEHTYSFTFRQACFPDLIQISKPVTGRRIHLNEKEFSNLGVFVKRFMFLEDVILRCNIDVVFCDQSPEAEMEFGRAICLKYNKIFIRQTSSFLARSTIHQQFEFGKECLAEPEYDLHYGQEDACRLIEDYTQKNKAPYAYPALCEYNESMINKVIVKIKQASLSALLSNVRYHAENMIHRFFYLLEDIFAKRLIRDKYDPNKRYIFFGFHLTDESTIVHRGLPYTNQVSLIECISRVLPYGYYLYVREHPTWRSHFSYSFLSPLSKLPNVRLIPLSVSVHTVLKNAKAVLTYNSTMGIEALMYQKPVLSFAPNVYFPYHPAVIYCSSLFDIGAKIVDLINTQVKMQDTCDYLVKLMRISCNIVLGSDTFLSDSDAEDKAKRFADYFVQSVRWCLINSRKEIKNNE